MEFSEFYEFGVNLADPGGGGGLGARPPLPCQNRPKKWVAHALHYNSCFLGPTCPKFLNPLVKFIVHTVVDPDIIDVNG